MRVQVLVTKNDFNLPNIEHELQDLDINYEVEFVEEHPELVSALNIRHSPNIIVDGQLIFQHTPTEGELKTFFTTH